MLPLLIPDLVIPPASLLLLTSVLAASSSWLVLQLISSALSPRSTVFAPLLYQGDDARKSKGVIGKEEGVKVVLVSFLRDWEFWRAEGRRVVGLNTQAVKPFSCRSTDL